MHQSIRAAEYLKKAVSVSKGSETDRFNLFNAIIDAAWFYNKKQQSYS